MISEAIDRVLELAPPNKVEFNGHEYYDKPLHILQPPLASAVVLTTLQGLVDLYEANLDGIKSTDVLVHVTSPTTVEIVSRETDSYGRRFVWASSKYPDACKPFPFGNFLDPENFTIKVQTSFQRVLIQNDDGTMAKDFDYVLKMAAKITAGKERVNADDGISQTVNVKAGVTLRAEETVQPIVNLAPYRTFAEIDQVVSKFIFRARGDERGAELALFEADGGRWRLSAVAAIADWLGNKLSGVPIIS
jgi:hypothetical protein